MCRNVCFCAEKLAFIEPAKRQFTNCFCVHKINQNKHNFSPKFLAPIDNFVKHFSAGFVFDFLLFSISKLLIFLSQNEKKNKQHAAKQRMRILSDFHLRVQCFCSILMS